MQKTSKKDTKPLRDQNITDNDVYIKSRTQVSPAIMMFHCWNNIKRLYEDCSLLFVLFFSVEYWTSLDKAIKLEKLLCWILYIENEYCEKKFFYKFYLNNFMLNEHTSFKLVFETDCKN